MLAGLTAGCVSTGTSNPELTTASAPQASATASAPQVSTPAPAGKVRLALNRVQGVLYAGAPATVKVNGQKVADLWAGNSSVVDISPGKNAVTVEAWSYPGTWTIDLDAKPGQSYAIEVSPRSESYVPSLFGAVGGAMDSNANKNAGAFQMRLVSQ